MPAVSIQLFLASALAIAVTFTSPVVFARGGSRYSGGHSGLHSGENSGSHSSGSRTNSLNGSASQSYTGTHSAPTRASGQHRGAYAQGAQRDSHGRIERSAKAKRDFQKLHPCPSTGGASGSCPGYVVDHVTPLKRGGADRPSNMQWQTIQQAKEKDRTE